MIEVRGHARGGQGMVTAFEILAKTFGQLGEFQVQSFPAFGVERTGAPIQAFLRISRNQILNRSNVYTPDLVVVFDETLIEQIPVFDGLRKNGVILLNTERQPSEFSGEARNICTVPATRISISKGLGSRSLPIVNAAMIGAIINILGADIDAAIKTICENVPARPEANAEAARIAHDSIHGVEGTERAFSARPMLDESWTSTVEQSKYIEDGGNNNKAEVEYPTTPAWGEPMSRNKTGNWRVLTPKFERRGAPCVSNCPAGTDVRSFVALVSEGKFKEACDTIYEHNPFPATCGRVCPHFCQQNCNRTGFDEGLNIGAIERFLGDYGTTRALPSEIRFREKIAIIGSGPAGLTAALRLRRQGYEAIVFEAMPQPGGMMRTGIPQFRLPKIILDREIERIVKQGVTIRLNSKVAVPDLENDYSAVVVATGSHIPTTMTIHNENLALQGIEFLREYKLNDGNRNDIRKGDRVAIIGGGNTAIDVARTVLRLGAEPIIYYRRTRTEMPAIRGEVEEAEAEGVQIEFLRAPAAIAQCNDGQLVATMIRMQLAEPDESGRRKPVPVAGSETDVEIDKIIMAVGQTHDDFAFMRQAVKPAQGMIAFPAKVPVFCCGDMAWGGTVTEAIGSGNLVAREVHAYLRNEEFTRKPVDEDIVLPEDINFAYYLPTPGHHNPVKRNGYLEGDFSEVVTGLTEEEVVAETRRCLHCGDCFTCGNCYNYCPDAAIHVDDDNRLRIDYDYCKGCGICFQECPCAAISLGLEQVDHA